jgi:hypothetical protein
MIWKSPGFQLPAAAAIVAIIALVAPCADHFGYGASSTQQEGTAGPVWSPGQKGDPQEDAS